MKNTYPHVVCALLVLMAPLLVKPQDSTYLILGGDTSWVNYQADVYAFQMDDHQPYLGQLPASLIDTIVYDVDSTNYIYFDSTANRLDIDSIISIIESDPLFESHFPVISWYRDHYQAGRYLLTNNLISVQFKDSNITADKITDFMQDFHLAMYSQPDASLSGNHIYIFRVLPIEGEYESSIDRCISIHESSNLIQLCHPDLGYGVPMSVPNDPKFSDSWYLKNSGNTTCGSGAMLGADIDIEAAWNRGNQFGYGDSYTGKGIVIGVIDADNYQWTHPDLKGQFVTGYDAIRDTTITTDYYERYHRSHGTWVSSIAVAKADNNEGITGVAYNAKVRPFAHNYYESTITLCFQKAQLDKYKVDILNLSFGVGAFQNAEDATKFGSYVELYECAVGGRGGKGIVIIAASGNDLAGYFPRQFNFPNALEEVLTVGASTPQDSVKKIGDGFAVGADWNSMYPPSLDVVAPGTCIWGADLWGTNGSSPDGYYKIGGTSGAAPIVAGIAAMILEKNPDLKAPQVYEIIRKSAEKIGGYNYNADGNRPGWSEEAGYGRVNASKAVRQYTPTVSMHEFEHEFNFQFNNPVNNQLQIQGNQPGKYWVKILDALSKIHYEQRHSFEGEIELDVTSLASGSYLLQIQSEDQEFNWIRKVVKR